MTGTVIHIPTGRLIHDNEDSACNDREAKPEDIVFDIVAPDGRSVFSIRKVMEEMDNRKGR